MLLLFLLLVLVPLLPWACGSNTTPTPFLAGDVGPLQDADRDAGETRDGADLALVDLKPTDHAAGDQAADTAEVTLRDNLTDLAEIPGDAGLDAGADGEAEALQGEDTVPEVVQPCGGACSPYELCSEADDTCLPNPLCSLDFCTGTPGGAGRLELDGKVVYVDLLEWPGVQGQVPLAPVVFADAQALCRTAGRRLCAEAELVAACGNPGKFPYGDTYQGSACNTELPFKLAGAGTFEACQGPALAAMDLVGNAIEWTAEGTLFGGSCFDGTQGRCLGRPVPEEGYAHPEVIGLRCCTAPADDLDEDGAPASLDCDEANPGIFVGAPELCDGEDNDCNGVVDDAPDGDGDTYGACEDCNDGDLAIHPGADDQVGDGVDLDCDGFDGVDGDGDGHASLASGGGDCDDQAPLVHPGVPDPCDGVDNDCDGTPDAPAIPGACDDGLICTDDQCDSELGACVHLVSQCADEDPCTDDECTEPGGCAHSPNAAPCADGDPCTLGDHCEGGACSPGLDQLECDDQNTCTADSCVPTVGCSNAPIDVPCEDGDPCTLGDLCVEGECLKGAGALACDDGNPCTGDNCVPKVGCQHPAKAGPCNDQDPCTSGEHCVDGVCGGGEMMCLCAKDSDCLVHDDGKKCNGILRCLGPAPLHCVFDPASVVVCPDSPNPGCSEYYCNEADGECRFRLINSNGPCDDGQGCTLDDKCVSGACTGASCASKGLECWQGACVACAPKCDGRVCGSDGCGGQCGTCPGGALCTAAGQCCVPNCNGQQCGGDGCGGSCGACNPGLSCVAGECRGCGDLKCRDGETQCTCMGDCGNPCAGKQCGLNQCNWSCGNCPGNQDACINNWCYCQPWCGGKQCGADGCGGACGYCQNGWSCVSGQCQGCGDGVCNNNETRCTCPGDCGQPCQGKTCGADPYGCGQSCGSCAAGLACVSGTSCVGCGDGSCNNGETKCTCPGDCGLACQGRTCGADPFGCNQNCGTCAGGLTCVGGTSCVGCGDGACNNGETKCTCKADCGDPCAGKECGDNGCGGSCGSCSGILNYCKGNGNCLY
jgi:hypothetical protein